MSDLELMTAIKTKCGDLLTSSSNASSVPAAFLAALIANESGGNPDANRFEPAVFAALGEVLLGRKAAYGSIGKQDLLLFALPAQISAPAQGGLSSSGCATLFGSALQRLASLATSWGLTQVMGYEAIAYRILSDGVTALQEPISEMNITTRMLADFGHRFQLDLTMPDDATRSEFFDCWNSGRPHAPTADPQYIPNGLARFALYQGLA